MLRPLLSLTLFVTPWLMVQKDSSNESYIKAADARDAAALEALWLKSPARVLPTFDQDLEGSLALWERAPEKPDLAGIERLEARALFAAGVAAEVLQRPLLLDYAASFVGWSDLQKLDFRAGQQAFGKSRERLAEDDFEAALLAATDCRDRAEGLGDWWGLAMGEGGRAQALFELGRFDEALVAAARGRLVNGQLGLGRDEGQCALWVARCCVKLERFERGAAAGRQALATFEKGPKELRVLALECLVACERALGREVAASDYEKRLQSER